jgi:VPDSG-CTERM motif
MVQKLDWYLICCNLGRQRANKMKTKTSSTKVPTPFSLRQSAGRSFPLAPTLVAAAFIACSLLQTRADTIALSFTGGSLRGVNATNPVFGWAFALGSGVTVTQLGLWDEGNDGFNTSHTVAIWTSAGTLLAQATIPSGTSGTLIDGFRYVSIAALDLTAGDYTIGEQSSTFLTTDNHVVGANSITTASGVTYDGSRSDFFPFGGFGFPAGDIFNEPRSYFGPNFQFTGGVPTPDSGSTVSLLGCAFLGLAALRRKLSC